MDFNSNMLTVNILTYSFHAGCPCIMESLSRKYLLELGICTFLYDTPGLYTYRLHQEDNSRAKECSFCSIVVQSKQKVSCFWLDMHLLLV